MSLGLALTARYAVCRRDSLITTTAEGVAFEYEVLE
jgi:hypothetical protein